MKILLHINPQMQWNCYQTSFSFVHISEERISIRWHDDEDLLLESIQRIYLDLIFNNRILIAKKRSWLSAEWVGKCKITNFYSNRGIFIMIWLIFCTVSDTFYFCPHRLIKCFALYYWNSTTIQFISRISTKSGIFDIATGE